MEKEWSFYGGGQFNGGRWPCYSSQYNGGRMVVTQVASINEGCH